MESVNSASVIVEDQNYNPKSLAQVPEKGNKKLDREKYAPTLFHSCNFFEGNRKRSNFETNQIQSFFSSKISFNPRIRKETTFTSRKGSTGKISNYSCVNLPF